MLQKLTIQNYAIIDQLQVDFSAHLNTITGETGAGKSILMGALSLILGERADSSVLVNRDKKCVIEGWFRKQTGSPVQSFLSENDLDGDDEILILRREITSNGKSRAFINDTPVTLAQIRELASLLVDLHQQFDTLELGEQDFQRQVLDALAGQDTLLQEYQIVYRQYRDSLHACRKLQEEKLAFQKEQDYYQFLWQELDDLQLQPDELEQLDQENQLLSQAETIKQALSKITYELKESEQPIVNLLKQQLQQLHGFSGYHPKLSVLSERLQSAQIELKDIADELEEVNDSLHYDAARIERVNQRLAAGYKLLKKHAVQTTAELLQIQAELAQKLQQQLNRDESIAALEQEAQRHLKQAENLAGALSIARHKQAPLLEDNVNRLLKQVGMPNARLKVNVTGQSLTETGKDNIEFLFNANMPAGVSVEKGLFEPLRKVASGGELSRLMLCIKSLVAACMDLPTMIFDEIDTGISGEAAKQVGILLKTLSAKRQVICITHQPQIAGKADAQYYVYKQSEQDQIHTRIRLLDTQERIQIIARMLSGEKPTQAAIENAREMIAG